MKNIIYFSLFISIFLSCHNEKKVEKIKHSEKISTSRKNDNVLNKFNCVKEKRHLFSDKKQLDIFKILYNCKNLEDSMKFQIFQSTGRLIYELNFKGTDFYDYSRPWYVYITDPKFGNDFDPEKLSDKIKDSLHYEDLKFISGKIEEIFKEENFERNPLVNSEYNLIDESYLAEFENDKKIKGFSFTIGSVEGYETIAYSKLKKKVLTIYATD